MTDFCPAAVVSRTDRVLRELAVQCLADVAAVPAAVLAQRTSDPGAGHDLRRRRGTGGLALPFVKAVSRVLLRNALPSGHRATFYDLWAGHKRRPTRFRKHLEEDLGHVFTLLADGSLRASIAARFLVDDVAAALTLAESRTVSGKIILLP